MYRKKIVNNQYLSWDFRDYIQLGSYKNLNPNIRPMDGGFTGAADDR